MVNKKELTLAQKKAIETSEKRFKDILTKAKNFKANIPQGNSSCGGCSRRK